ncbi:50S ribosomal protein L13 [Candidatus Woesearchaeota archaeon]|nr:50S ribosomal protein L13 [Candidatus Woesearchaeota archaeon]
MIIDANNMVLGRLASFVAKKALLGENIQVVNCEKAVITGDKKGILKKYQKRSEVGRPKKGPFQPKAPNLFVRKVIRGMLPYKKNRGREAYKKIMCHFSVPENLKDGTPTKVDGADVLKMSNIKYLKVERICKFLGWEK